MLVDWFTVFAQIVNFLVLVALLRHFLWDRLVRAIDERERRVSERLAEAQEKSKEAELRAGWVAAQMTTLDRKRDEMLARAQKEADEQRAELVQRAREDVHKLEARWRQDLQREESAFLEEVRKRAAAEMFVIIRRALADLACTDIQRSSIQVFLEKLRTLDAAVVHDLAEGELTVLTAVDLAEEIRQQVQAALEARLGRPAKVRFERSAAMSWGIELRGRGRRIGWTSDSYIEALEDDLRTALENPAELLAQ